MPIPLQWHISSVEDTFATVAGGVSTLIRAANPGRCNLVIVNDCDATVYLARGNAAVIGSGIRLNANGGSYEINELNMFFGDIYGIATGQDDCNVTVSEGI